MRRRVSERATCTQIISLSFLPFFFHLSSTSHSSVSSSSSSLQAHRISIFCLQPDTCICLHFCFNPIDQVPPLGNGTYHGASQRIESQVQVPGTPENEASSGSSLSRPPRSGDHSPSPALSRRPPSPPPSRSPPRTPLLQYHNPQSTEA